MKWDKRPRCGAPTIGPDFTCHNRPRTAGKRCHLHREKVTATVTTNVARCARCGNDHDEMEWKSFKHPAGEWTHWSLCPTTGEPVLFRVVVQA